MSCMRPAFSPAKAPNTKINHIFGFDSANAGRLTRRFFACYVLSLYFFLIAAKPSIGQPPGTPPPQNFIGAGSEESEEGVPIRAFMFLSESGNPVVMPSLSWEEFDRYLKLDSGVETSEQKYSYQSLEISGKALEQRAELDIRLKLVVDSTDGGWVNIPIKLGNFHQLEPISLEPAVEAISTVSADNSGYRLLVKSDKRVETTLTMRVSARIDFNANSQSLGFKLPNVPSRVSVEVADTTANAEVLGQGDEIVEVERTDANGVKVTVESSGGDYMLRWGSNRETVESSPIYELDSRTTVRWDSPQDQPTASVRFDLNNLRGAVKEFSLKLPGNAVLLDAPVVSDTGQVLDIGPAMTISGEQIRQVSVPAEIKQQRLELSFEYQLVNETASSSSPLQFRVPSIVGALRHRGDLEFSTPDEYRLRWRSTSWVRSVIFDSSAESGSDRSYRFNFDRPGFTLPLWLGENERQLRISSRSELTTRERNAVLWMQVEITGQTEDGLLRFDDAGWEVRVVESQLGTPLVTFEEEGLRVVDLSSLSNEEASQLIFQFHRVLETSTETPTVDLNIPRISVSNAREVIRDSSLTLVNDGRMALVVDLKSSRGLSRSSLIENSLNPSSDSTSYQLIDGVDSAKVVGNLVERPTQITLTSDTLIELDGDTLKTNCDWVVSTLVDLEGRLGIRIPSANKKWEDQTDEKQQPVPGVASSDPLTAEPSEWLVTVDDLPARLNYLEGDRYTLISDRLTSGTMRVRFRNQRKLEGSFSEGVFASIPMPRPAVSDVTLRGPVIVNFEGDPQRDFVSIDEPSAKRLELAQIPRVPLRARLSNKQEQDSELEVGQTVIRSLLGSSIQHDQLLTTIAGGEFYEVNLTVNPSEVTVKCFIDGEPVAVRLNQSSLIIPLKNDPEEQLIDLRLWSPVVTNNFINELTPIFNLEGFVNGVYWQVLTAVDSHVVWASHSLGRSMTWRYDRWKLYRDANYSDDALLDLVGAKVNLMPPGNRYLYRGFETGAFRVLLVSRVALWIVIGSMAILLTVVVTKFGFFRHPATLVAALAILLGICVVAPEGVILAGQYTLLALMLVIVMISVRLSLRPESKRRLFANPSRTKNQSIQTLELVTDMSDTKEGMNT